MPIEIASPWKRIIEYPDNHLNDFCLFRALDARWHCIGIMGTGTWASETSLFHCSSPSLYGPYERHSPLLADLKQGVTSNNAPQKHAPFVVARGGLYRMFFRRPWGTNLVLVSKDLFSWPSEPRVVFEENDARDACIQNFGGVYHWYYCQWREIDGAGRSCIRVRRSSDLLSWDRPVDAHVDASRQVTHSQLESPFAVFAAGRYWLFVRDRSRDERCVTTVFESGSPLSFPSGVEAWSSTLENTHAPELVRDGEQWHIARVSGMGLPVSPARGGWIDIARINFA